MSAAEVVAEARRRGVALVRFEYCDVSGIAHCKAVHVDRLQQKLREGVNLTRAQMAITMLEHVVPIEGMEPVGEIRLLPDPGTFSVLPWVPAGAGLLCDQVNHDGRPWGACPRTYLKQAIARAAEHGVTVRAAFENEYYLAREEDGRFVPVDAPGHAPVYSAIGHDLTAGLTVETMAALEAQGMTVEQAINEYGPGQQEISVGYTDALRAADHQVKFRDAVRGTALRHGLLASFAAKPYPDEIGSGAHVHLSLWDAEGGRNLLHDPTAPGGLSEVGRRFVAGVTEHLPALTALTTPSYNSFRRLRPGAWAAATTAWGFDNREAAVRVCSPFTGREEESLNLEVKTSDGSANPYLSLGALITCGLDGIARGLQPGEPSAHDPARLPPAELARGKVRPLPTTMRAALDELEKDEVLLGSMDELLARCYLAVRRSEDEEFSAHDEEFELRAHFYRF
ncbi:glutamine synthetase family protein [Geodermatophilus ruber]|uniref:Glutamine synthetase n=1 Tax=Geodermatophilus ruber TaxID=504800 RepID=A0A1I4IMG0_9ACTN|nr:glutamine synthetase family protein [Geodermatophilus ruber]SFL55455.1 glutamine synthetase [Geodermatophilus ruber]